MTDTHRHIKTHRCTLTYSYKHTHVETQIQIDMHTSAVYFYVIWTQLESLERRASNEKGTP